MSIEPDLRTVADCTTAAAVAGGVGARLYNLVSHNPECNPWEARLYNLASNKMQHPESNPSKARFVQPSLVGGGPCQAAVVGSIGGSSSRSSSGSSGR